MRVHAVEPDAVQLVWSSLPTRTASLSVGDRTVSLEAGPPAWAHHPYRAARPLGCGRGGPGAIAIDGLRSGVAHPVTLHLEDRDLSVGEVVTPPPPPGALLGRFATMSDLHVGERRFGALGGIVDVQPPSARADRYADRCFAAALDEARAWGAELVVLKGDLTAHTRPDELRRVDRLVATSQLPALAQPGNHDVYATSGLGGALPAMDLAVGDQLVVRDVPGLRIVVADTSIFQQRRGRMGRARIHAVADAAHQAAHGVVVSLHHPPRRFAAATSYPPGLERGDSEALLHALRRANPAAVVVAGHTHRNRTYRIDGVRVAEVGSTKDYPGGWGGYLVYEGGLVQTVRRTARADVIAWTEATARAVGGLWGRWSPGRIGDRCWTERW